MKTITQTEWRYHLKEYKTIIKGQHYIMKFVEGSGTCLVPVRIVNESEIKKS